MVRAIYGASGALALDSRVVSRTTMTIDITSNPINRAPKSRKVPGCTQAPAANPPQPSGPPVATSRAMRRAKGPTTTSEATMKSRKIAAAGGYAVIEGVDQKFGARHDHSRRAVIRRGLGIVEQLP